MPIRASNPQRCSDPLCDKSAFAKELCREHYQQKYYAANRTRECRRSRERHAEAAPQKREHRYRTLYNITPEEFDRIREFMAAHSTYRLLLNGPNATSREAVEHRHSDGKIRGVMATMLNKAYGFIERLCGENTSAVLRALADFHDNHPASQALGEDVYGIIGKAKQKKVMLYGPTGSDTPQPRGMFEKVRRGE